MILRIGVRRVGIRGWMKKKNELKWKRSRVFCFCSSAKYATWYNTRLKSRYQSWVFYYDGIGLNARLLEIRDFSRVFEVAFSPLQMWNWKHDLGQYVNEVAFCLQPRIHLQFLQKHPFFKIYTLYPKNLKCNLDHSFAKIIIARTCKLAKTCILPPSNGSKRP